MDTETDMEDDAITPKRQIPDFGIWAKPFCSDVRFTIRGNPLLGSDENFVMFAPPGTPRSQIETAIRPEFDLDHIRPASPGKRTWVFYP